MNDTGIASSWLEAYILVGLLGFLERKVIDKILAASLKLCCLGKDWCKKTKTVSEGVEEQFDLCWRRSFKKLVQICLKRIVEHHEGL